LGVQISKEETVRCGSLDDTLSACTVYEDNFCSCQLPKDPTCLNLERQFLNFKFSVTFNVRKSHRGFHRPNDDIRWLVVDQAWQVHQQRHDDADKDHQLSE
jgi:hypothetical protein